MHEAGHSNQSSERDGMGKKMGGGSGGGTHVHLWLIHVNVWQNPSQYCKVISLQLKQIKKEKDKASSTK